MYKYLELSQFSRVFCIGRNYSEHVKELNNETPQSPVVFMKPATSLLIDKKEIHFPSHGNDLHHEAEIVILIGKNGRATSKNQSLEFWI